MKKHYYLLFCLSIMILVSCQKNEPQLSKNNGSISISVGFIITEEDGITRNLKSAHQTENFKVIIYRENGSEFRTFERAMDMPDTIILEPGNYYVEAHSDNDLPAAFENPFYSGSSDIFSVESGIQQSVTVNCTLANTAVSVGYSEMVRTNFIDYTTTVSTSLGSLTFDKDELRPGYFRTLPINIRVELIYLNPDGSPNTKVLTGTIPQADPGKHYKISVNTGIDLGKSTFEIVLDNKEIPVEIIELTDKIPEPVAGAIRFGEILITEIMFDPSSLSDTQGEWFEIYNNSNRTINLQNLVFTRDEANKLTIKGSIELHTGQFYVLAKTDLAVAPSPAYIYGSSITLPNAGAVLAIYNEDSGTARGALIFEVNYGNPGFPAPAGASISLNPGKFNTTEAVLGSSWCTSVSTYATGDLGTPGLMNDTCR